MRTEPRYSRQTQAVKTARFEFLRADGSSMKRDTEAAFSYALHTDLYALAHELHRVVARHGYRELVCSKFPQIDRFPVWTRPGAPYNDSWWRDWWKL